jgi:quercetin dioxygenase-like cupin family protein
MAYKGQVLDNPVSGERFVFHTTADDSDGALLAFDVVIAPDGHVPGAHVHPVQEERFEIVTGAVRFRKGRKTVVASAGDVVVVPPGTAHRFTNASDEEAVMRVHVTPALKTEELFETVVALATEGRTLRSGMPKPLELALFMREFEQEVRAPVGASVARAVMAPLAWLAARRGLDRRYRLAAARREQLRRPMPTRPGNGRPSSVRPAPSRPAGTRSDASARPKGRP